MSLILPSGYFHDLGKESDTLNKTDKGQSERDGVIRQSEDRGDLLGPDQVNAHNDEVPAHPKKERYAQNTRGDLHNIPRFFGHFLKQEIDEDMSFSHGGVRDGEADYHRPQKGDHLEVSDNRLPKGPHDDIGQGEDQHKGQGQSGYQQKKSAHLPLESEPGIHEFLLLEKLTDQRAMKPAPDRL